MELWRKKSENQKFLRLADKFVENKRFCADKYGAISWYWLSSDRYRSRRPDIWVSYYFFFFPQKCLFRDIPIQVKEIQIPEIKNLEKYRDPELTESHAAWLIPKPPLPTLNILDNLQHSALGGVQYWTFWFQGFIWQNTAVRSSRTKIVLVFKLIFTE